MAKKKITQADIRRKAIGLIDSRQTDDDGLLIKRDSNVTMNDLFGTDQMVAVAHFVSELMAKGYDNCSMLEEIKNKYSVELKIADLNRIRMLLKVIWRSTTAHTMNDQIAAELNRINVQERELWKAYEYSKTGNKHVKTEVGTNIIGGEAVGVDMVTTDTDENAGDMKIFKLITDLGVERRKLLGLYAPEKKVLSAGGNGGAGGGNVNIVIVGADGNAIGAQVNQPAAAAQIEEQTPEVIETRQDDELEPEMAEIYEKYQNQ